MLLFSDLENLVECITGFSHHLGDCVIHGIATSQSTAEIESGHDLANLCRSAGESGLSVLTAVEKGRVPCFMESQSLKVKDTKYFKIVLKCKCLLSFLQSASNKTLLRKPYSCVTFCK